MSLIKKVRHSVGVRLLVGFWLTLLFAIACVWLLSQWQNAGLEFERLEPQEKRTLQFAKQRLQRALSRSESMLQLLEIASRRGPRMALYDVDEDRVLSLPYRHKHRLDKDIAELATQSTPLKVTRPPYQLIGPEKVTLNARHYLLFVHRQLSPGMGGFPRALYMIISLVVLSVLFSILFTRSLVTPIKTLHKTSQRLASGNLTARVDETLCGKDELGELATGFNKMADKLAENLQTQQRLLADVSHELRSPLTRLNMAVALAEQASKDDPVVTEALRRIELETARMDDLIGNVLVLSRTENALREKVETTLDELLAPVIANAEFEAKQTGKTLNVSQIPALVVKVQIEGVQSAIENVIRNAIRYANNTVDMHISAENGAHTNWIVEVSDDGPGLSTEDISRIFAPFYRAQLARDRQSGGVGLGLAIAKAAMTAHDGKISANNSDAGGLIVKLTFPH